ncbi:MAG: ABC transporter ATP-binding protein [Clostridiaceae bacterium]
MCKLMVTGIYMNYHSKLGETSALHNISFSIDDGEFVSLVGPSGCGKSTLLNIIAHLIKPSYGDIYLDGKPLTDISPDIGYMFQNDELFDWLSVFDNIALGLKIQKKLDDKSREHINNLVKEYNLYGFINRKPRELSGGMRQRVALLRTLALDPKILLLDEPFSALDYQTRLKVNDDVSNIIKKERKTALMVTHDIAEAISMSDRVIILSNRPAEIKEEIKIDIDKNLTPLQRREDPGFRLYFNKIWKELNIYE